MKIILKYNSYYFKILYTLFIKIKIDFFKLYKE